MFEVPQGGPTRTTLWLSPAVTSVGAEVELTPAVSSGRRNILAL